MIEFNKYLKLVVVDLPQGYFQCIMFNAHVKSVGHQDCKH